MFKFRSGGNRIVIDSIDIHTSKNGRVRCFGVGTKITEDSVQSFEEEGAGFDTFEALAQMLENSRKSLSSKKPKKSS